MCNDQILYIFSFLRTTNYFSWFWLRWRNFRDSYIWDWTYSKIPHFLSSREIRSRRVVRSLQPSESRRHIPGAADKSRWRYPDLKFILIFKLFFIRQNLWPNLTPENQLFRRIKAIKITELVLDYFLSLNCRNLCVHFRHI